MKLTFLGLLFFVVLDLFQIGFCQTKSVYSNIPSLNEVSGNWVNADTSKMEPSIRNFRAQALCNRDMSSLSWFASAPYSGGYHTGVLKVNGEVPSAQLWRWLPWEALRKTTTSVCAISSSVRMLPDNDLIMWQIEITNNTAIDQQYEVTQDLIGFVSRYNTAPWPWSYPYPTLKGKINKRTNEIVDVRNNIGVSPAEYKFAPAEYGEPVISPADQKFPSDSEILSSSKYKILVANQNSLVISDQESICFTAFSLIDKPDKLIPKNSGGTAYWSLNLKRGETKKIRFFMTYAPSSNRVIWNMNKWKNVFSPIFSSVEKIWKKRWMQIFKPHNEIFSGCFPVLQTKDSAVRKVYYTGPLTMLYLLNTNLPAHKRINLTGGPRWGATVTFYWDITEWSTLWATVDPVMMKEQISSWIQIDPSKYFGQDNYGGKGVGNGYVANYWALFQHIRSYITVTKDYAFLKKIIDGKTVLAHLSNYAYNWKKISIYGKPGCTADEYKLADFGDDPWNLLECVPTYIHIVPSFNAGYVWMMRETAKFYRYSGKIDIAQKMNAEADTMAQRVLKLYAGKGVWNSLYPDDKKVEVRHVLDFMFLGKFMNKDLPDSIRKAMVDFAYKELITEHWMRAQSLNDIAAKNSDRPDHGPLGAFDGWPPGTMDALSEMGYMDSALQFYQNVEPVTFEGCWAQAHELWGENKYTKNAKVRIPERGWNNRESSAGIEFSQVVLKNFMGFYPQIDGDIVQHYGPKINFSGNLYNLLYGGKYYNIHNKDGIISMQALKNKVK